MDRGQLLDHYRTTRRKSVELCEPLKPEDYRVQTMPDVSPPWWNLGHTTWFYAKNVLEPRDRYRFEDDRLEYVLNSYYETHGPRLPRPERGLVTRPTTEEIYDFRREVDGRMEQLIAEVEGQETERIAFLVTIGVHHEQQHQELLLTEVKHILAAKPGDLREPYCSPPRPLRGRHAARPEWAVVEGGLKEFGNVEGGWCWDNELPVHKAYTERFAILNRLITAGEFLEFVEDGGYRDPLLWLANGWERVQEDGWGAPLYWERAEGDWQLWTLAGSRPLIPEEPVAHVSFYEADAFASWRAKQGGDWSGARLPTEREWELAARSADFPARGSNFMDSGEYHPRPSGNGRPGLLQMAGDLWEWTSNHYEPYPGYQPFGGALMEYNGKFMDNQRVLRGGSCATPGNHIRVSYRNFWAPDTRFQFTGIRLARSIG